MAQYLTTDQLDLRMKPDLVERAEPDQKQVAIKDSSDEVDSYLRAASFDLPLPGTVGDGAFLSNVAAIARYKLATMLYLIPEPASSSQYYLDYKRAVEWFRGLRTGETVLAITDGDTSNDATTQPAGGVVVSSNTLRGW
jgi:phage gp36-like protein